MGQGAADVGEEEVQRRSGKRKQRLIDKVQYSRDVVVHSRECAVWATNGATSSASDIRILVSIISLGTRPPPGGYAQSLECLRACNLVYQVPADRVHQSGSPELSIDALHR